jgi:hypothetical protein
MPPLRKLPEAGDDELPSRHLRKASGDAQQ